MDLFHYKISTFSRLVSPITFVFISASCGDSSITNRRRKETIVFEFKFKYCEKATKFKKISHKKYSSNMKGFVWNFPFSSFSALCLKTACLRTRTMNAQWSLFHWNPELLGLSRQIGQINSGEFGVFSAKLSAPILVHESLVHVFQYSTVISTKKTKF